MQYSFLTNIATLWKIGHVKKAPGTAGSFAALLLAPLCFLPFSYFVRFLLILAIFLIGIIASNKAEQELQQKDPSSVIIDEVVGQWIALFPVNACSYMSLEAFSYSQMYIMIFAFLFFRVFDISKLGPIGLCDRKIKGGLGIMVDDVVAGIFAALFIYPLQFYANLLF